MKGVNRQRTICVVSGCGENFKKDSPEYIRHLNIHVLESNLSKPKDKPHGKKIHGQADKGRT